MKDFAKFYYFCLFFSNIKNWFSSIRIWRLQRQNSFIPNSTLRDVIKKEGIRYLWKGNAVVIKGVPNIL